MTINQYHRCKNCTSSKMELFLLLENFYSRFAYYFTHKPTGLIMDTPQLNDHNKQEYPPMHNGEFDASPIVIYTSEDNTISLDVKLENETVWLSRSQLSILFDRDIKTIGKHINNALKEELEGLPIVANFATTAFKSQSLH